MRTAPPEALRRRLEALRRRLEATRADVAAAITLAASRQSPRDPYPDPIALAIVDRAARDALADLAELREAARGLRARLEDLHAPLGPEDRHR